MTITNPNLDTPKKGKRIDRAITTKTPRRLFSTKKPKVKKDPPEWRLQAEVVSAFHKMQDAGERFEFAGDMNAGKRNGARALLCGLKAGETDIRIYLPVARLKMIELKTLHGELSQDQIDRHEDLIELGFEIETVYAKTPKEAAVKCTNLLKHWIVEGETMQ
jgi:hypothetical protein